MKKFVVCLVAITFVFSVGADLIITETLDGTLSGGLPKALEISNTGALPVDLSAYEIAVYANGGTTPNTVSALSGTIAAKSAYTFTASGSAGAYNTVWGSAPSDGAVTAISSNGDDVYALRLLDDTIIDVCGVIGQDGSGEVWEYLDSWIKRKNTITVASDTFNSDDWEYGGANAMDGFDAAQIATAVPGMGIYSQIPEPAIFGLIGLVLLFFRRK